MNVSSYGLHVQSAWHDHFGLIDSNLETSRAPVDKLYSAGPGNRGR